MDEMVNQRLHMLQMSDLGTARRENISTADHKLYRGRIEDIEASRRSNKPGSKEQRVAQANKSRLEGWCNVYKEINDTGDLEALDSLLNGQSHRLQLNTNIGQGESEHTKHRNRRAGHSTGSVQSAPILSRSMSGTGGRTRSPEANRPLSRITAAPGKNPPKPLNALDPALDRANTRNSAAPRQRSASSAPNAPALKTRRPIGNYSPRNISSPEDFMASVYFKESTINPSAASPRPTTATLTSPKPLNPGHEPKQIAQSEGSVIQTPNNKSEAPNPDSKADSTIKDPAETKPQAILANTTELPAQKSNELLLDLSTTPREVESEPGRSPALEDLEGLDFKQPTQHSRGLSSESTNNKPATQEVHERKPDEQEVIEATTSPVEQELDEELAEAYERDYNLTCELLERHNLTDTFSSSLGETKRKLESRLRLRRRPRQQSTPQSPELNESVSSADHSRARSDSRADTPSPQTRLNATAPQFTPKSFTKYRSLSNATSTESSASVRLALNEVDPEDRTADDESDSTIIHAPMGAPSPRPESASPSPNSTITGQRIPGRTHTFGDHLLPGGRSRIPSIPSQPAVIIQPVATFPTMIALQPVVTPQPQEPHIIGDHLLPGWSTNKYEIAGPVSSSTNSDLFTPPKKSLVTISAPSQTKKTASSNTSIKSTTKSPSATTSSLTPGAPQFEPAKQALVLIPTNAQTPTAAVTPTSKTTSALTSVMESMYAPKPQSKVTSFASPKKSSTGQGLMASRYSDPKWV
ncbi:hypothetical protein BJX70DRAFT_394760 [Aspergillus crustosus]